MKKQIKSTAKEELLGFKTSDLQELYDLKCDYHFYQGECEDIDKALSDETLWGQTWCPNPEAGYMPTVDIRNKVKPLLNKQKRFMFGQHPIIRLKPLDDADRDKAEELTAFITSILDSTGFWKDLQQAFLSATLKKRVLMRVEANPGEPIEIYFEEVEDFNFVTNPRNYKKLEKVILVKRDPLDPEDEEDTHTWYRYTYYMNPITQTCWLLTEEYDDDMVDREPDRISNVDTLLSSLPCWLIVNGGSLGNNKGESDLKDLIGIQNQYNRKISDFADALRFQMFGETYIIDGHPDTVNEIRIAPNSLCPIKSLNEDMKASVQKIQSQFSSIDPIEKFLTRCEKDMHDMLCIPMPEQLVNVPSGKSMQYIYSDQKARCEEKWNDWESPLEKLIYFIFESCAKLRCYQDWDINWNSIQFTVQIEHKYPIPEDEDAKKELAIKEVEANVRSRDSYIQDFTNAEDSEGTWDKILTELQELKDSEADTFTGELNTELFGNPEGENEPPAE